MTIKTPIPNRTYLGDGVYAEVDANDRSMIIIDTMRDGKKHWLVLEPETLAALNKYAEQFWGKSK